MKIEVCCPSCDNRYLVEEAEAGDEFLCPACSSPIALSVPKRHVAAAATASAGAVARPPATTTATMAPPATTATTATTTGTIDPPREVVCPRCNLHFAPRDSRAAANRRATVLVVEDMTYFREIAKEALAGMYEVRTADGVAAAHEALAAGGIDLLVLDLTLDGGDRGIEILHALPDKTFPILIYTAQDESEMYGERWEELRSLGADDIVIKGMNVGESLLRKVGSLLGKNDEEEDWSPT